MKARELCLQFVAEWKAGKRPDIATFLADVEDEKRRRILTDLLNADMMQRREIGENPTPNDYLERFPNDRPTISAAFDAISDTLTDGSQSAQISNGGLGSTEVDVAIGQTLGKYEIRNVLGKGGMGVVFGAYDNVIRRDVAIKLLSAKHSNDETALSRLLQEARTAGAIQHPNIVAIHDVLEENGSYYVVMERVHGDNLSQILAESPEGHAHWRSASRIIVDCCDALSAAHDRGMIHRDIKPQNIMLTKDSKAKLLDFGLAKSEHPGDTALTGIGTVLGTPDFMSPEQCRAAETNHRSDIYSLGATYYALLTGRPPYASEGSHLKVMYAHCHEPVPKARDIVPDLPPRCDVIIQKAMAKDQEQRYQTAREFKADLETLINSDGSPTVVMEPSEPAPPSTSMQRGKGRNTLWGLLGAIAALVITVAVGVYAFGPWNNSTGDPLDGSDNGDVGQQPAASVFRGVTADTITFGTTTVYSGPSSELGHNMTIGIKACFDSVNAEGGIHGRKLELRILDDGYNPDRALNNMVELFEDRKVLAVIGNVGTPTARVTVPYAVENDYLFFAPFTGASLLRNDPPDRYVFNYRASYEDETAAMVRYFVDELRIPADKIAVFAQNDAYGDDGFRGVAKAMRSYGLRESDLLRVGYARNQLDVTEAVQNIMDESRDIQTVVMVPTYKVAARFIKAVKETKPDMLFGAVSFVDGKALAEEFQEIGPGFGEGVIVTQVVPHYLSNATGVLKYRRDLKKFYPEYHPGFVSLEGYIAAQCMVHALEKAGPELTTEKLVDALESIRDLDLGIGPIISFSPSRHQASKRVWATRLKTDGSFENVDID